jgi:heme-degrading monooxygenase HmoA
MRLTRQGKNMFTSIRKYKVIHGSAEELARRVREGFVHLIRQMPGFRSYYLLDGGPDVLITISRFDSADEAYASNEKAANWVRNNVLEFTKGMPEVMVGSTLIAEVKE